MVSALAAGCGRRAADSCLAPPICHDPAGLARLNAQPPSCPPRTPAAARRSAARPLSRRPPPSFPQAATGEAFAIALAFYAAVCLGLALAFSLWLKAPWARRFFAPKSFAAQGKVRRRRRQRRRCRCMRPGSTHLPPSRLRPSCVQPRPKHIRARNPLSWVLTTAEAPEGAVLLFAGADGLMYL